MNAAGGEHVLVVDDEPQILRALRVILRNAGYEVATAETKSEALDAVSVRPPDAMVLDLVLPDGSGVDVTSEVRTWSSLPIIVLSAVGDEREKVRALDVGADDYITKPSAPRSCLRACAPFCGGPARSATARWWSWATCRSTWRTAV
jgi:two-component system KDP operon response regulator KdpE